MKTKFLCWMPDYHGGEEKAAVIESVMDEYPDYVAKEACDYWYSRGVWSGDPIPPDFDVYVRNTETQDLFLVTVYTDYSVSFSGGAPLKLPGVKKEVRR